MKVDFQDWMFRLRRSGTQPFTNHIRTRTHTGLRCHRNSALRMIPIKLLIISHTLNLTDCVQVSDRHTHTELQSTQTPAVFTTQTCLFHDIISKAKSQINKRKKTLAVAQLSGPPRKKKKKKSSVTKITKHINRRLYTCTVIGTFNELWSVRPAPPTPTSLIFTKKEKITGMVKLISAPPLSLCLVSSDNACWYEMTCVIKKKKQKKPNNVWSASHSKDPWR